MDAAPNCAICNGPAYPECQCESERLQIALKQAEQRALEPKMAEIRDWVIHHARHHVLNAFTHLKQTRTAAHTAYLNSLPNYSVYMTYSGHPPIHPAYIAQLQSQIAEAHAELKRGIDADWRASVLRYPEVLDYFYSLVHVRMPDDDDPSVVQPPFAAAGYADRGYDHSRVGVGAEGREGRKKKRKKRGGLGLEAPYDEQMISVPSRALRHAGPPAAPTPPVQTAGYTHPPGIYRF